MRPKKFFRRSFGPIDISLNDPISGTELSNGRGSGPITIHVETRVLANDRSKTEKIRGENRGVTRRKERGWGLSRRVARNGEEGSSNEKCRGGRRRGGKRKRKGQAAGERERFGGAFLSSLLPHPRGVTN